MNLAIAALRLMRWRLHRHAFELHSRGRSEAAQAVWGVVQSIDALLIRLQARRRHA